MSNWRQISFLCHSFIKDESKLVIPTELQSLVVLFYPHITCAMCHRFFWQRPTDCMQKTHLFCPDCVSTALLDGCHLCHDEKKPTMIIRSMSPCRGFISSDHTSYKTDDFISTLNDKFDVLIQEMRLGFGQLRDEIGQLKEPIILTSS
eukprot:1080296_1